MLLECLPSGWPSRGTGNNTGAIGAAQPKTEQPIWGLCSPSLCRVAGHCRVGRANNKGLNLLRLKCSDTEPEQLHGILVPGWNTYRAGLGAMGGLRTAVKVSKCSRRITFGRQCQHPPRIPTAQAPPPPTSLCHSVPACLRGSGRFTAQKPRFASNHICSNKEWRKDEVYRKGNTPADCHRSFISILVLIWWWILHGFPSCNEYINTSNVSSLCSENDTSS